MIVDAILEGIREIHAISGQKCHTLPFRHDDLVEAQPRRPRNIKIVSLRVVLSIMIVKEREPKLKQVEIKSCLLDPFVELAVVREETLYVLHLGDQAGELAIEGDEVCGFYVAEDEVDVFVEVSAVDLHLACWIICNKVGKRQ